jgi:hypothetical protein
MGHLERGEKNVSITSVVRVSAALGITLSELFAGIDGGDESVPLPRRKLQNSAELDRKRLLLELAAAERSIQVAREIAAPPVTEPPVGKRKAFKS